MEISKQKIIISVFVLIAVYFIYKNFNKSNKSKFADDSRTPLLYTGWYPNSYTKNRYEDLKLKKAMFVASGTSKSGNLYDDVVKKLKSVNMPDTNLNAYNELFYKYNNGKNVGIALDPDGNFRVFYSNQGLDIKNIQMGGYAGAKVFYLKN